MDIDLEHYRRELHISSQPLVRLSVVDNSPVSPLTLIHNPQS